jgi:cytoskeletal protein RodZ
VAVLVLVLVGIFAVGFAFGWRITDTFRKPAKQKAKQAALAKHETAPSSQPKGTSPSSTPQTSQPQTTQPVAPAAVTATVSGSGVRMRSTADPNGAIVGQLKSGEKVVILGDAIGTDGKAWAKVQGTVTASGKDIQGEGYVRNDLLNR